MRGGQNKSVGMLLLFLVTGAVLGGILGEILASSSVLAGIAPYLIKQFHIFDMSPVVINLYVIRLVIGFTLQPNLISILGVVTAIIVFRRF